nr:MAG TPA: hypothetical protein [Caudoviricetes sp.]
MKILFTVYIDSGLNSVYRFYMIASDHRNGKLSPF